MQVEYVSPILIENISVFSELLNREILIDIYLPRKVTDLSQVSLLLINDGQDMEKMHFQSILDHLYTEEAIEPLLFVAIHAGIERRMEYGTQHHLDYKERGAKAGSYTAFIFDELLPFIRNKFTVSSFKEKAFAGFSLGGLSALDIVWNRPGEFSKVGLFSASLWWRSIDQVEEEYDDDLHRIMHQQIRQGKYAPWLKFFFQCGNMDETKDRNHNGIIDSIDDTLDLIKELEVKGYDRKNDIHYLEMKDGHHDVFTWGRAMPEFLKWGWGKDNKI
ncbi:MAG: esterase [Chitinophagaceae bacterium]|jgi:enterochelin esterase-like enzyme|nr:esterase [Chitinophagaceae bacterium]MBK7680333.1 esterase [Chitinophagaceae bacterium]MBK8301764.1 esterase [Chitinophagaceae bacterium]MBK9466322.1 esterase [Chitinophagaceae bacterium]MBK9661169.1 esterase [Chitinophagaceae bacterium]